MKRTMLIQALAVCFVLCMRPSLWALSTITVTVEDASRLKAEIVNANGRDPQKYHTLIYLKAGTYFVKDIAPIRRNIRIVGVDASSTIISGAKDCVKDDQALLPGGLEFNPSDDNVKYEQCLGNSDTGSFFFGDRHTLFRVDPGGFLWLERVTIRDGMSTGIGGGGIHNEGTLMVNVSTVMHNFTNWGGGGGIYNSGTLYVYDSTIRQNFARSADGGGIYNDRGGYVEISHSTISDNVGGCAGGIFNGNSTSPGSNGGPLAITNSTISNNKVIAKVNGAGCESSVNEGISAGGILSFGSYEAWLKNVTITENVNFTSGSTSTGGVAGGPRGTLGGIYPLNTLIANNYKSGLAKEASECYGFVNSAGGNFIGNKTGSRSSCVIINFNKPQQADVLNEADPRLGKLRDNGGNTCTHGLLPGSKAILGGWPKGSPGGYELDEYDQRWVERLDKSDIGAYAFSSYPPLLGLACTSK